jgi:hypothetical protein
MAATSTVSGANPVVSCPLVKLSHRTTSISLGRQVFVKNGSSGL